MASKKVKITTEQESLLWENKILTLTTSQGLTRAVIFYIIKCFGIFQGKALRQLKTDSLKFGEDDIGSYVSLDVRPACSTGRVMKRYDDPGNPRSVYKIMRKYYSYLANEGPLLVRPIFSIKDYICYSPWPLGITIIDQMVQTMMEENDMGHCYGNISVSLLAIETLRRFGAGSHCIATWVLKLFSVYIKMYPNDFRECTSVNCEEKSNEACLMMSRLLDPPYPSDAVEMLQNLEKKELAAKKMDAERTKTFSSWMSNILTDSEDASGKVVVKEEQNDEDGEKEAENNRKDGKALHRSKHKKGSSRRDSKSSGLKTPSVSPRSPTLSIPPHHSESFLSNHSAKTDSSNEDQEPKILTVLSIRDSALSIQLDEGKNTTSGAGEADSDRPIADHSMNIEAKGPKRKLCDGAEKVGALEGKKLKLEENLSEDDEWQSLKENGYNNDGDNGNSSGGEFEENLKVHFDEDSENEGSCTAVYDDSILMLEDIEDHDPRDDLGEQDEHHDCEVIDHSSNSVEKFVIEETVRDGRLKSEISKSRTGVETPVRKKESSDEKHVHHSSKKPSDSIQILRCLLQEGYVGSQGEKKFNESSALHKNTNEDLKKDVVVSVNSRHDNISTESNSSQSPPQLSPQPLVTWNTDQQLGGDGGEVDTEADSTKSPASDIVKFLDTAQLQMQSLLRSSLSNPFPQTSTAKSTISVNSVVNIGSDQSSRKSKDIPCGGDSLIPSSFSSTSYSTQRKKNNSVAESHQKRLAGTRFPAQSLTTISSDSGTGRVENKKPTLSGVTNGMSCPLLRSVLQGQQSLYSESKTSAKSAVGDHTPADSDVDKTPYQSRINLSTPGNNKPVLTLETHKALSKAEKSDHFPSKSCSRPSNSESSPFSSEPMIEGGLGVCPSSTVPERHRDNFSTSSQMVHSKEAESSFLFTATSPSSSPSPSPSSSPSISSVSKSMPSSSSSCPGERSGTYRYCSDHREKVAYQTLQIKSEHGCETFMMADLPWSAGCHRLSPKMDYSNRRVTTSEISLGDYLPPGTLIPAHGLRLLTHQGPGGMELVLKFDYNYSGGGSSTGGVSGCDGHT